MKIHIYLITIIVSFCSIVYELIYSQALTILYGGTVLRYSVTIGLYLLSLGIGAFIFQYLPFKNKSLTFWWNELLLSIGGPLGVLLLFLLSAWNMSLGEKYTDISIILSHIPVLFVGILSGFELPLLVQLSSEKDIQKFSKVLGLDYVGSFIGTIVYSMLLYPSLGLIGTALTVGFLNFLSTFIFSFLSFIKSTVVKVLSTILLVVYILILFQAPHIQSWISKIYRTNEIKRLFLYDAHHRNTTIKNINIEASFQTAYQDVTSYKVEFENGEKDYCLNLDSNVQLCESWWSSYHESLANIPMKALANERVHALVIGGGDWIGIQYLLQFRNIVLIDHVDIDEDFMNYMKTHSFFSKIHKNSFENPKVKTFVEDAYTFMRRNTKTYDLIIVDLPGITHDKLSHLYSVEFYEFIRRSLSEIGIVSLWDYGSDKIYRKHYKVFMNTLIEAGFTNHIAYNSFDISATGEDLYQTFYLLTRSSHAHQLSNLPSFRQTWTWLPLPYFENISPNTVFKPNYNIIVH